MMEMKVVGDKLVDKKTDYCLFVTNHVDYDHTRPLRYKTDNNLKLPDNGFVSFTVGYDNGAPFLSVGLYRIFQEDDIELRTILIEIFRNCGQDFSTGTFKFDTPHRTFLDRIGKEVKIFGMASIKSISYFETFEFGPEYDYPDKIVSIKEDVIPVILKRAKRLVEICKEIKEKQIAPEVIQIEL